jgi:hypothetical protein
MKEIQNLLDQYLHQKDILQDALDLVRSTKYMGLTHDLIIEISRIDHLVMALRISLNLPKE